MDQTCRMTVVLGSVIVLCGLAMVASPANAGGLYIREFGTPAMGVASNGDGALANDASTSFHNPAGMTRLKDHQVMTTAGIAVSDVKFDPDEDTPVSGGSGGNQGGPAPILGAFYVHSLSDQWKLGASLISLSGAILDPNDDWAGRFQVQDVSLFTLTFTPTVAYRVTDWLSLGAGALLTYARLNYDIAFPPPAGGGQVELDKLDDFEPGFIVGALATVSPRTRVGLIYISEVEFDLGGDIKINPIGAQASIDTNIPLAQVVRASLYHELTDELTLLASADWEGWSVFDDQFVSVRQATGSLPRNWNDTWSIGAGLQYKLNDAWMVQGGFTYDSSPVDSGDRTADLPVDEQFRYALGVQHQLRDNVKIGAAFTYANLGKAEIDSSSLRGDYERNQVFFFAINMNWGGLWGSG